MSTDSPPDVSVDVDLEANQAEVRVITTEVVEVPELFNDDGELRLWADCAGWNGFVVDDGIYYDVNARHDDEELITKKRAHPTRSVPPSRATSATRSPASVAVSSGGAIRHEPVGTARRQRRPPRPGHRARKDRRPPDRTARLRGPHRRGARSLPSRLGIEQGTELVFGYRAATDTLLVVPEERLDEGHWRGQFVGRE